MRSAAKGIQKSSKSWTWLQGIICGAIVAIAPGTAVLFATLAAPALGMMATSGPKEAPVRAIMLAGAASSCTPLRLLWEQGGTLTAALDILADPSRPLLSWVACGLAWLSCYVIEAVIRFTDQLRTAVSAKSLVHEREALVREWSNP